MVSLFILGALLLGCGYFLYNYADKIFFNNVGKKEGDSAFVRQAKFDLPPI